MAFFKRFRSKQNGIEDEPKVESEPAPSEEVAAACDPEESAECDAPDLGPLAKLPAFTPVVVKLLFLFGEDDVDIGRVARLVESDPALTSELLTFVNAPIFGLPSKMTSASHAARLLGLDAVLALTTTVAVRNLMRFVTRSNSVRRLWRHSMATSLIAAEIAPCYGLPKDLAQTAGILHDLGRIGLVAAGGETYPEVMGRNYKTSAEVREAERAAWGMDHCEAGALLGTAWKLPKSLQQAIARHHESLAGNDLVSLVHTACALADDCSFDAVTCSDGSEIASTVQTCVPEEFREKLMLKLSDLQKKLARRVEKLDL
jgi:putative nucleotidyltransferase with HDIG domain